MRLNRKFFKDTINVFKAIFASLTLSEIGARFVLRDFAEQEKVNTVEKKLDEIPNLQIWVENGVADAERDRFLDVFQKVYNFLPKQFADRLEILKIEVRREGAGYSGMYFGHLTLIKVQVDANMSDKDYAIILLHEFMHLFDDPPITDHFVLPEVGYDLLEKLQLAEDYENIFPDLLTQKERQDWLEISKENGGYVGYRNNTGGKQNFAFSYFNTWERYGAAHFVEDIACTFSQILYIFYSKGFTQNLLNLTPGEIGLFKKYQIACDVLIRKFQNQYSGTDDTEKAKVNDLIRRLENTKIFIQTQILANESSAKQNTDLLAQSAGGNQSPSEAQQRELDSLAVKNLQQVLATSATHEVSATQQNPAPVELPSWFMKMGIVTLLTRENPHMDRRKFMETMLAILGGR